MANGTDEERGPLLLVMIEVQVITKTKMTVRKLWMIKTSEVPYSRNERVTERMTLRGNMFN